MLISDAEYGLIGFNGKNNFLWHLPGFVIRVFHLQDALPPGLIEWHLPGFVIRVFHLQDALPPGLIEWHLPGFVIRVFCLQDALQPWLIEWHLPGFVIRDFRRQDDLPHRANRVVSTWVCVQNFLSTRCLADLG
jgi:hypothetical protein